MSILIDKSTRVLVQAITGREGQFHTRAMLDYGTQVVSGVTPGKGGQEVFGVPVFDTVQDAVKKTGANASIIFVPARQNATDSILEATAAGIPLVVCISDGMPINDMVKTVRYVRSTATRLIGGDARFEELMAKVVAFLEAPGRSLDLPLDPRGTVFQRRVWQALRTIPAGETTTYAFVAGRIGSPTSVRAVARACAANAIAVAIPCHRVVRADGALSGYRWGVERKRVLLERESAA